MIDFTEEEISKILESIEQSRRQREKFQDKECSKGHHGLYLRCIGFGIDSIYWKCDHCQRVITTNDSPMTI